MGYASLTGIRSPSPAPALSLFRRGRHGRRGASDPLGSKARARTYLTRMEGHPHPLPPRSYAFPSPHASISPFPLLTLGLCREGAELCRETAVARTTPLPVEMAACA